MSWHLLSQLLFEIDTLRLELTELNALTSACIDPTKVTEVTTKLQARIQKISSLTVQCSISYSKITFTSSQSGQTVYATDYFTNLLSVAITRLMISIAAAQTESFAVLQELLAQVGEERSGLNSLYKTLVELFSPPLVEK